MTPARACALALGAAVLAAIAGILISIQPPQQAAISQRVAAERPRLALLTGLPLMFGDDFAIYPAGSPALTALQARYRVEPISTGSEMAGPGLLLMAQPSAQRPEDLVAIDDWVRGGGRLLLLADPALAWPSERPLGDPMRPPPAFADTGLLTRWGLRLDAPEESGPQLRRVAGKEVATVSSGTLFATGSRCRVEAGGLVGRCRIGRGRVTVIADADFLDIGRSEGVDGPTGDNLPVLIGELTALEPPAIR
jgi:hypothetical protein